MNVSASLAPEWRRINLLGACLACTRHGKGIGPETKQHLHNLQQEVDVIRRQNPWEGVSSHFGFNGLDQDILACALAPEAEPKLGWMYQELQPGISSPYPTPALIRELFFMGEEESGSVHERLTNTSPLVRSGMIAHPVYENYQPVKPTYRASISLLGWPITAGLAPPGGVQIEPYGTWDDLVLSPSCIKALREFLLWITCQEQVVGRWGARIQGGPVALFAGPSGTGKTFAAEVLANALGWPLFRIDLGLLVSKYIGETEKNLNALFEFAHGKPMLLLFDEADSLFGKRGEVREARDRYANMEVSHLLSRLERHQGPCILTSNLRRYLDPAFARRFQTVVEFPRPDAHAREELWKRHLPPKAPLSNDVDVPIIAASVALTGGQIRNAALHAAFLAAHESVPIALMHIASAVWTELAKEGRELMRSNLGELADHLPEGVT